MFEDVRAKGTDASWENLKNQNSDGRQAAAAVKLGEVRSMDQW